METKNNKHHNSKVALNRGEKWRKNLIAGKHESSLNPTKLKVSRIKKRISQDVISANVNTSVNTFGSIERGKRPVSKERAEAISKQFGRKINYFFKKVDEAGKKYVAKQLDSK